MRQLTVAKRVKEGSTLTNGKVVVRVTGSPGRPPKDGVRLVRLHLSTGGYEAVRENAPIEIQP